jgi:hypothetical protein
MVLQPCSRKRSDQAWNGERDERERYSRMAARADHHAGVGAAGSPRFPRQPGRWPPREPVVREDHSTFSAVGAARRAQAVVMIQVYAAIVIALFGAGAITGSLIIIAVGIHRDGRARSMTISNPYRTAAGARAACGVYAHPRMSAERPSRDGTLVH